MNNFQQSEPVTESYNEQASESRPIPGTLEMVGHNESEHERQWLWSEYNYHGHLAHSHHILNISMSPIRATVSYATTACLSPSNPTDDSYSEGKTMIIFRAMKRLEVSLGTGKIDEYNMNSIQMHHISNITLRSLFYGVLCTLGCG